MEDANLVPNLISLRRAAHDLAIPIFFVPHHQWTENDYADWNLLTTSQDRVKKAKLFEKGSWGADFHPDLQVDYSKGDVLITNHWNSSGFVSTDLDYQLRRHGIQTVICAGLIANTCLVRREKQNVERNRWPGLT
jgi:nicotinamidase-related amidase